jgi:predicted ester cyclase
MTTLTVGPAGWFGLTSGSPFGLGRPCLPSGWQARRHDNLSAPAAAGLSGMPGQLSTPRWEERMAAEENKALVRRFYEQVWDRGNVEFAGEVFADDYLRHDLRPTAAAPGPQGQRQITAAFRAAFPDLRWHVDLLLAEGDLVAGRWTASGTNTVRGLESPPPASTQRSRASTSSAFGTARSSRSGTTVTTLASRSSWGHRSTRRAATRPSSQRTSMSW